jgi:hypothetical protein
MHPKRAHSFFCRRKSQNRQQRIYGLTAAPTAAGAKRVLQEVTSQGTPHLIP